MQYAKIKYSRRDYSALVQTNVLPAVGLQAYPCFGIQNRPPSRGSASYASLAMALRNMSKEDLTDSGLQNLYYNFA